MLYFYAYVLVGTLLVIIKSPIRELVDKEVTKTEIHTAISGKEVPAIKLILFRVILSTVLIFIYPVMLFVDFQERRQKRKEFSEELEIAPESHMSWTQDKISIQEAEAKHMVEMDGQHVPFGYMHFAWTALLNKMQEGDELYEFGSSDESWKNLAGREGIALVRKGEIVADIVTRMN